ncbi:xylulokinase [Jannaschia sp. Os4]|uniref:xylulokinase n=1 Tax=Jannaschia sp. Os4 TaxID=2807617 RepID=UPI001939DF96|nr:xylulokinase [Jannaschia sp. Os4]MBM2575924.1 xylulokinase [Jannaschia sp. Os4]
MHLGIDLGTSSVKVLLVDGDRAVAETSAPLSVQRPRDGWAEQDCESWVTATRAAVAALDHDLSGLEGLAIAGHMHGACLVGADGTALRPCLLWNDTRASAEAAEWDDAEARRVTGNIAFPGFTAPKVEWVRRHEPEVFAATRLVLLPKDYLRLRLTGEAWSEMSDASGTAWLDVGARDWSDALLARGGLSRERMPRLAEGSEATARISAEGARLTGLPEGVPVAGGAGDNAAAAVGTGAVAPGRGFVSLGTSGVLFVSSASYDPDPATAVHTFAHAVPGTWHQMGVILAATDALEWAARLTGRAAAELASADIAAPGRTTFLPYLGGERTPHNDAALRGTLLGIDHATDAAALGRAVMEGVAFALRDCRDALAATGTEIGPLLAVGGGARSEGWLRMVATALDHPLEVAAGASHGAALGAARLARMAGGAGAEVAAPPRIERVVEPVADLRGAYEDGVARYRAAHAATRGL